VDAPSVYINGIELDTDALANACTMAQPAPDHHDLLQCIHAALPDRVFQHELSRSGWYRIGGIVTQQGERIAENLREWAEREYANDIHALMDKCAHNNWFATRLQGQTHYFYASTGNGCRDFIQLEVEEVLEVLDHPLFDDDASLDDLEEFIDPLHVSRLEMEPVAEPRYQFRRATLITDLIEKLIDPEGKEPTIGRLLMDWERSSAFESAPFHHHWVLILSPYTDRYGEQQYSIKPLSTYTDILPTIDDSQIEPGTGLANLIHGFDRQLGYPMAWYFFMLGNCKVSPRLAEAIHLDLMSAYDYLPPRDVKVLQDWIEEPYSV